MSNISELTREALSLSVDDRVQLAQELWASLQSPPSDSEADALDLADQRDTELEDGSVTGVFHKDAIAQARKSLECE